MVFDKTGTLTRGQPRVVAVEGFDCQIGYGVEDIVRYAAVSEKLSEHPLARAVTRRAAEMGLTVPDPETCAMQQGQGATARYEGLEFVLGSRAHLRRNGLLISPRVEGYVTGRVARVLVRMAAVTGERTEDGAVRIITPLSRRDIADMSGTIIDTAIRTMSKFQFAVAPCVGNLTEDIDCTIIILSNYSDLLFSIFVGDGMKISAKEEYGLRAMAELAKRYNDGPVPLSEIARAEELSMDYLEQIFPSLRAAGLVNSTRGAKGGYELSRSPAEITVGDVLRALAGEIFDLECLSEKDAPPCVREAVCVVHSVWKAVYDRVVETLDSTTLADLRLSDKAEQV